MFRKFTQYNDPVFIDVGKIISFHKYSVDGTEIVVPGDTIFVDESVEDVIGIIEGCTCVK